mgnify:CR=1
MEHYGTQVLDRFKDISGRKDSDTWDKSSFAFCHPPLHEYNVFADLGAFPG